MSIERMSASEGAIEARDLRRVYVRGRRFFGSRSEIVAVASISFSVPRGTIFGLLGPNGAGKTTTIKMLSTLLTPTAGTASVAGYDVVRDDRRVRRHLGVVLGGDRGLYAKLSARDNLIYFGHLYGMKQVHIKRRTDEMLELVNLRERAGERVEGYSRGMKQRLHLAKALLHDPPILILDEPTIGLDPGAAVDLRAAIGALVPEHTVLLTTHDMYEADQLCKEIAIVESGAIVAQGSPEELKERVVDARRVTVSTRGQLNGRASDIRAQLGRLPGVRGVDDRSESSDSTVWTILCSDSAVTLDATLAILRTHAVEVTGLRVIEPTLEDAFLALAGRSFD